MNESQLEAYVNKYYADYDNWKSDSDDKGGMIPSFWGSENGSTYNDDNATDNHKAPMDDILRIPGLLPRAVASGIYQYQCSKLLFADSGASFREWRIDRY